MTREIHHGHRAALAGWVAEVERVRVPPMHVERDAIRTLAHRDLREQRLVRDAEHTEARGSAIRREEKIALRVDEDARDAGMTGERAQVGMFGAVEHVDPVRPGVRDVHAAATCGAIHVGVIESRSRPRRDRDRGDLPERHRFPTFSLQYAYSASSTAAEAFRWAWSSG